MTVITIDGPAGTGKSTVAKRLAEKLGFTHYDTGAMYRAITWLALERSTVLSNPAQRADLVSAFEFHIEQGASERRYFLGNIDVSELIRAPEVTQYVSEVSAYPDIRDALVAAQRLAGEQGDIVCEGRDLGTVVFPHAAYKFFLTARPEVRACRRFEDLKKKNPQLTEAEVLADQKRRDTFDSTREHSPLRPADDAIEIDTSDLSLDQVVETLYAKVSRQ
jgi:CMP/dCMP kinase